jgi:hypothetical protein
MHNIDEAVLTISLAVVLLAGCATIGTNGTGTSSPSGTIGRNADNTEVGIKTREHLDLWLHRSGWFRMIRHCAVSPRGYKAV